MPWKECHVVDERLRFIARLLDGEKMTALCAEFGISRKTGYKIYERYKDCGAHGLTDAANGPEKSGAGEWTRTTDLLITNQLLYQLSYTGKVGPDIVAHRRQTPAAARWVQTAVVRAGVRHKIKGGKALGGSVTRVATRGRRRCRRTTRTYDTHAYFW